MEGEACFLAPVGEGEMRLRMLLEKKSRRQRSEETNIIVSAAKLEETVERTTYNGLFWRYPLPLELKALLA